MSLSQVEFILSRHEIVLKDITQTFSVYKAINNKEKEIGRDLLTFEEHLILFNTFWDLGNKKRSKQLDIEISEHLKFKIIASRKKLPRYDMVAEGHFEGRVAQSIVDHCEITPTEEAEVWSIFHTLWHSDSVRNCEQIDGILGLFKIVDSKLRWLRKINVLDVGCGKYGNGIATLAAKYETVINGFGFDLHLEKYPSNVVLKEGSIYKIPYRDNFFDVAYSSNVMYYFSDSRIIVALKEVLRVLKPKGLFTFDDKSRNLKTYQKIIIPGTGIRARAVNYYGGSILIIKY